jgi:MFS family permease
VQALHSMGETMFAVSLAGSLFFSVSLDAARPRIVLYLAVTMTPFVVLAPLVGRVIDRVRGGHRVVLLATLVMRMVVALLLASQLKSILFYPEAFVMLVLAKSFSVSRNAIVPVLVEDHDYLTIVNSRLARTAAIAGALASPIAVLVLQLTDAGWVLRLGAVAYGLGAFFALRLPVAHVDPVTSPLVEATELSGPGVRSATWAMAAVRGAIGFSLFHLGFILKQSGEPAWVFGALAIASGVGGFIGTFVAARIRRVLSRQGVLTAALVLPALVGIVATLRFHRVSTSLFAFALGLGASVARRAFDGVVQTEAPHARRGRAYAGIETQLELAWVIGALLAIVARAPDWLGIGVLTAWFAVVALAREQSRRAAVHLQAEVGPVPLPLRLLETADALAARGDVNQAAVVALAAIDVVSPNSALTPVDDRLESWRRCGTAPTGADAELLVHFAHELVANAYSGPDDTDGPRPMSRR